MPKNFLILVILPPWQKIGIDTVKMMDSADDSLAETWKPSASLHYFIFPKLFLSPYTFCIKYFKYFLYFPIWLKQVRTTIKIDMQTYALE